MLRRGKKNIFGAKLLMKEKDIPIKIFSRAEIKVIISLINMFQDDGAVWTINNVKLNDLKQKLKKGTKK